MDMINNTLSKLNKYRN